MNLLTGDEVKHRLYLQGSNLKQWAIKNGYKSHDVWNVVNGRNKATFGRGREIAIKLGMKADTTSQA